jgi:hypothetical protein
MRLIELRFLIPALVNAVDPLCLHPPLCTRRATQLKLHNLLEFRH